VIDSMGLADTSDSDDQIIAKIKDFLKTGVSHINWLILAINGTEKMTRESLGVLSLLTESFGLDTKDAKNNVICVTHSDGWNSNAQNRFREGLQATAEFGKLQKYHAVQIIFTGVPDPTEMDTEDDVEYATKKEKGARGLILEALPFTEEKMFSKLIEEIKQAEIRGLVDQLVAAKLKQRTCTIL